VKEVRASLDSEMSWLRRNRKITTVGEKACSMRKTQNLLGNCSNKEMVDYKEYQEHIRSLKYRTIVICPDLSFAVGVLGTYYEDPTPLARQKMNARWVIIYLSRTVGY